MTAPKFSIRFMREEDLPHIHRILTSPKVMWGTLQVPSRQLGPMSGQWQMDSENGFTLVAEMAEGPEQGKVIGNCGLKRGTGRRSHVAGLGMSVDPEYHGMGVGTALMKACLEVAEKWWRPARVELEVYPDNEPAVRLYRKFGFEVEGKKRDLAIRAGKYVDVLVMSKIYDVQPHSNSDPSDEPCAEDVPVHGLGPAQPPFEPRGQFPKAQKSHVSPVVPKLEIRPPRPDDAENLRAFYSIPQVLTSSEFLPWTVPKASRIASDLQSPSHRHVFLCLSEGQVTGEVTLTCGSGRLARSGTVSVLLIPPEGETSRDSKVARGLLKAIVDLAEDWLALHRLEIQTYSDETWLVPALDENGFRQEACMRHASLRAGRYEDRLVWGRVSNRW
ncbi:MAG TPA: GNAT family N-acetyltransferase [Firmicutes bacterium]|nr:GNAT family N-acetyltransferase [Candidatus Fermentithermobacillaceae bacterium]